MEYDLPLRTQGIVDLLIGLDTEERAWDFEHNKCKGDLQIVSLMSKARGALMTAVDALNRIDTIVMEKARSEHNDEEYGEHET